MLTKSSWFQLVGLMISTHTHTHSWFLFVWFRLCESQTKRIIFMSWCLMSSTCLYFPPNRQSALLLLPNQSRWERKWLPWESGWVRGCRSCFIVSKHGFSSRTSCAFMSGETRFILHWVRLLKVEGFKIGLVQRATAQTRGPFKTKNTSELWNQRFSVTVQSDTESWTILLKFTEEAETKLFKLKEEH